VCSLISATLYFLAFSSPVVWYCLPFHGFVCFHFLCEEFLGESFVVVTWWSYIVLVFAYHGRLLLFIYFVFGFVFFIHICIQCLGHFSPLPLPLPPPSPTQTPSTPGRNYFAHISNFVEEKV
jgi:hypothetical protein